MSLKQQQQYAGSSSADAIETMVTNELKAKLAKLESQNSADMFDNQTGLVAQSKYSNLTVQGGPSRGSAFVKLNQLSPAQKQGTLSSASSLSTSSNLADLGYDSTSSSSSLTQNPLNKLVLMELALKKDS
jgi:hypothetical protein